MVAAALSRSSCGVQLKQSALFTETKYFRGEISKVTASLAALRELVVKELQKAAVDVAQLCTQKHSAHRT